MVSWWLAEDLLENSSFKDMGFNIIEYELEGYRDTFIGTIVFNKTTVPQNRCDEFRSVAKITDGLGYCSDRNYTTSINTSILEMENQLR